MDIEYYDGQKVYKIKNGKIIEGTVIQGWTNSCNLKWKDSKNTIVGSPAHSSRGNFFLTYEEALKARNALYLMKVPQFVIQFVVGTVLLGALLTWGIAFVLSVLASVGMCIYEIRTMDNPKQKFREIRDFGDYGDHGDSGGA